MQFVVVTTVCLSLVLMFVAYRWRKSVSQRRHSNVEVVREEIEYSRTLKGNSQEFEPEEVYPVSMRED